MLSRASCFILPILIWLAFAGWSSTAQPPADDVEGSQEQAMKTAVAKVAPSVVQIETSGGSDVIGTGPAMVRKGTAATTGLIVGADGYIISSAFNFANKPSAIFVAIPGQKDRLVAKALATDHTRMLTLLKVDAKNLPVPVAAPKKSLKVGQWSLAVGRTWSGVDGTPSMSIGIISALGRIWGKAIQTDAKVSPVNYGGPLIDLSGRVMGVLVPASPRGQDEAAGVEWYDSGIGFAIPLEDVFAALPRLKEGKDLNKGLLGVTLKSADIYGATPVVGHIAPDSAAQRAGIKPGDVVLEINGKPVVRQAQILHLLGEKYEGDSVSVKIKRGDKVLSFPDLKLSGTLTAFIHPFLGVLAMRDDPEVGEEVRYVFPGSPAETAGIKEGDRLMKISFAPMMPMTAFSGRDELTAMLNIIQPNTEIHLEVKRKDGKKTETVKLTLGTLTDEVPDTLPEVGTMKKALAPRKPAAAPTPNPATGPRPAGGPRQPGTPRPAQAEQPKKEEPKPEAKKDDKKKETGLLKRSNTTRDHDYWLYVPENYDPNISHALVIWLHPAGKEKDRETEKVIASWEDFCSDNHIILLCPKAESEAGWLGSEIDFVQQTARDVMNEYTIDAQRVVAHGMGNGGQMAFYLGFNARDLIRGVAAVGAVLTNPPKDNLANQRLAFFIAAGGKDPLVTAIQESKAKLTDHKFPVVYHEVPERGSQYLDGVTLNELIRWIDSLDRQ
jgi:S1-C subfamily serine protease/predicted esterase